MDWGAFYALAIDWGLQPSEFWAMCPEEWWLIYERKRPRDAELDYAGRLTESELDELEEMIEAMK